MQYLSICYPILILSTYLSPYSVFSEPFLRCFLFSRMRAFLRLSCWVGLVAMKCLTFCFSGKVFMSPWYLKGIFVGYSIPDGRFLSFKDLNMSFHCLLAYKVSAKKSTESLMGSLCRFSSALLPLGTVIHSCQLYYYIPCSRSFCIDKSQRSGRLFHRFPSFPRFGKFSAMIYLNMLSPPLSFSSPSGMPIILILCFLTDLDISQRLSSFLLVLVLSPPVFGAFQHVCPRLCWLTPLWCPLERSGTLYFISYIVSFISNIPDWFFFIVSIAFVK